MNHFKQYKDIYILNYLLIVIYYLFFSSVHLDINSGIMFTTYDSYTYRNASDEFYKFSETGFSNFRPFLYPLIINLILKPFGAIALWWMQVAFWFVSINFIFLSIKTITKSTVLSFIGALLMAINFSYFGLTMQCLTEVTTILLLSCLVYFMSTHFEQIRLLTFFHPVLFIFVLLAVLKPVFFLPVLFLLFIVLPFFYLTKYKTAPKQLITLLLILTPLLYQLTLMKVKYNTFSVSQIGNETFRNYLFAQGFQQNNSISLENARAQIKTMTDTEVNTYYFENKTTYIKIYFENLKANLNAFTSFLIGPRGFIYIGLGKYMTYVNSIYFYLHLIFIIPILTILYLSYKRKSWNILILIGGCFCLVYYLFLTSPVSFNEGDRLIITSMPIWIFLYSVTYHYLQKRGLKN